MDITKEEFMAFEEVRQSGATNMWDSIAVEDLSDGIVTHEIHLYVIKNYTKLAEEYLNNE